jgi:hypothetical protein
MDAQNRCPPMHNNITPMPTQNPWAPNVELWYALAKLQYITSSEVIMSGPQNLTAVNLFSNEMHYP